MNEKHKKFRQAKRLLKEQEVDKKENKKIDSFVKNTKIVNPKLLEYSVVKQGIKNNYKEIEEKTMIVEKQLQKNNELKNEEKRKLLKQKKLLKDVKRLELQAKKQSDINKQKELLIKVNEKTKIINKNIKTIENNLDLLAKQEIKIKEQLAKVNKLKKDNSGLMRKEIRQVNRLNSSPKGKTSENLKPDVAIKVENVRKIYASKGLLFEALKGVNLEFKKGTFNVILGKSGSGKTTLLNMISGLDRATTGSVIIDEVNIQALSNRQVTHFRRDNIGFVFQSYNLLPSLNVKDNIEIGRSLQTQKKLRRDIDDLLSQMEMENNKKKMTYELSGGQQQRVSIARALAKTPKVLIGDEPTGALDHNTTKKVFALFQEINKKYNTTVIIVTHNPEVAEMGHQVIHVKDGQIDKIVHNPNPKKAEVLFK